MTMTRNVLALTALCALLGPLTSCSGSDSDSVPQSKASSESPSPQTTASDKFKDQDCDATVKLTGEVKAKWSGGGSVTLKNGKVASYATTNDGIRVSILPKQGQFPATSTVTVDGVSYTVQSSGGVVKSDRKGGSASADADAVRVADGKQTTVHVVAEFDC